MLGFLATLVVVASCIGTPATESLPAPVATSPTMQATPDESTQTFTPSPTPTPIPIPTTPSTPTPPDTSTPNPTSTLTPATPPVKPTPPTPSLEDIIIKSNDLPVGWQLFFKGKKTGGIREWDINKSVSRPIDELEVIYKNGDGVPKSITNYIIWCNESDASYYYKQLKELKDSNLTITDFAIGDGGFTRVVRGPRLELNQITNVEQFKDIVIKGITVCFTKGAYYVKISSGSLELASEKDTLSLLQNLARRVEERIPAK